MNVCIKKQKLGEATRFRVSFSNLARILLGSSSVSQSEREPNMVNKHPSDADSKAEAKDTKKAKPQTSETVHLSAEELRKVSGGGHLPPPPPKTGP
jgi:hypothetical protein